jgi:hypothetical protein
LFKKIPDIKQSADEQSDAKSGDAITNNHEAHITPDDPTNKQSDDKISNTDSNYTIADDREAHIPPDGPAKGRGLQQSPRSGSIIAMIVAITATAINCCHQRQQQQGHHPHCQQLPLLSKKPPLVMLAPSHCLLC